ncbi:hypothetical protein [Streptomyces longwoodensis]|uniref:hypothetical protein n=1 Tax=Streptomyces longwoodensis TaxID=68231 RepID=UPI0033EFC218
MHPLWTAASSGTLSRSQTAKEDDDPGQVAGGCLGLVVLSPLAASRTDELVGGRELFVHGYLLVFRGVMAIAGTGMIRAAVVLRGCRDRESAD